MRLTKRSNDNYVVDNYISLNEPWKSPITKLGQLEDIEEELGIELVTLFKALKNGIYMERVSDDKIVETNCFLGLDGRKELRLFVSPYGLYHHLEDYGKTWTLTKEELCG